MSDFLNTLSFVVDFGFEFDVVVVAVVVVLARLSFVILEQNKLVLTSRFCISVLYYNQSMAKPSL